VSDAAGVKGELSRALKATEASLAKQVEGSIKASAKRAEEERRKGAAKDRAELAAQLEKTLAAQLGQVCKGEFGFVGSSCLLFVGGCAAGKDAGQVRSVCCFAVRTSCSCCFLHVSCLMLAGEFVAAAVCSGQYRVLQHEHGQQPSGCWHAVTLCRDSVTPP
jgi:hypothetical protein